MGSQDLQQARYDQLVRRVGGLYGGGSKVVEVLPELFPVLEMEDTTPELLALSGWRTAWQSTSRLSGVGNDSSSQLFNPVGSGHLVAITQVILYADTVTEVDMEIQGALLDTPVAGLFRDGRFGVPRRTVAVVSSLDGGVTGGGPRIRLEADTTYTLRDDNGLVVLSPGTGLNLGSVAFNLRLNVNYFWRERLASPSELSFP